MIEEAGDRPCRVALFGGALDSDKGPDDRKLAEASINGCHPGGLIDIMLADLRKEPMIFSPRSTSAIPTRGAMIGSRDCDCARPISGTMAPERFEYTIPIFSPIAV